MDDNMMVIPTKSGEVFGIVGAALGTGDDVVDLEMVAAAASVGGAATVAGQNVSAHPGRDRVDIVSEAENPSVFEFDVQADRPVTQCFFEGVDPNSGSPNHRYTPGAARLGQEGQVGGQQHMRTPTARSFRFEVFAQGVAEDGDEGVGLAVGVAIAGPVR